MMDMPVVHATLPDGPIRRARRDQGLNREGPKDAAESLRTRREKNRKAQISLRQRKRVAQQAIENRVVRTEETVAKMAGGIIELADRMLQSKAAKLDPDLLQTLRTCLRRNLTLVSVSIPEQVESDRAPVADSTFNPPDKLHVLAITGPGPDPDIQATCNPPPPSNHGVGEQNYSPPVQNVLGNGWMGHFPLPNGGASVSVGGARQNSQPDSLSINIIHFAMRRAYFALVAAGSPANSLALWAFKFSLQQRSREEVLLNLRWVLGPGHATLHLLAKRPLEALDAPKNITTLHHPLVDDAAMQSFKDSYPQETEPFLSAQDVQELLVYNGLRYIDNDVLELFIQIDADGRWVMPFPQVRPIRQPSDFLNPHVFFPSSRATTRSQGGVGSRSPRMTHIYISQSTFLYHLSSFTVCLAHGPAFVRACVQQVIKASLIDLEVG
ncbi:hypothetical protein CFAM422_003845 [Trichoderma lentiforme]|uniref:BZIP domain-containing protein n=1 Tax=Trichoderma lentiforme TaxID=1567552 RepID=A0A9P4XHJ6_9HYPO|nr:hypothetical protein CFAM422_003845 [Trichoderma lentiforme]